MSEKWFKNLIIVAVIGLAIGAWGMFQRLVYGHLHMAYGSYVPWGLWVAFDLYFLGLTAGAFIIAVLAYGFRLRLFAALGPLAVFTLLVTLLCELIIISLDLGHPFRVYRFLITPSFSSMLTWLVIFIVAMWAINLPWFYLLIREHLIKWGQEEGRPGRKIYQALAFGRTSYTEEDRQADQRRVRILAIISIPVGLIFFGLHGALFAILQNRPIWNSAMTPLLFIMAAILSGGALITFLASVFYPKEELMDSLGKFVRAFLLIFLFLEAVQIFVGYRGGVTAVVTSLNIMISGPYWWSFWIIHLLIGSLIPLYLLIWQAHNPKAVAWASFLILISFIAVRLDYLIPDLAVYKLEGLQNAFFSRRLRTDYVPNLNEWLVSIWVVSLGLLAFLLGTRWLPVISAGKGEEEHVS
jgi:Ni/Fe-hydrogenase subunit HybB-like protein